MNRKSDSEEEEYEGTILKTLESYDIPSRTLKYNPYDDKPIQPMKSISVVESFTEDGIPIDPDVTNEYYKNFDFDVDEENVSSRLDNDSDFRNSMSKTVIPSKKLNKRTPRIKKSKTISSNCNRYEYEKLIDAMENTLNLSKNSKANETFGDDSVNSVFGAQARNLKIQNLRVYVMNLIYIKE